MNNLLQKIGMYSHIIGVIMLCNVPPIASKTTSLQKLLEKREQKIKQIENKHTTKKTKKNISTPVYLPIDKELPIIICIYAHNNSEWIQFNLDSALHQEYENYRIIYIDDASTDNTSEQVKHYLQNENSKVQIELISFSEPQGKLKAMYSILNDCQDEEIVVLLNACDWFANQYVLRSLCKEYIEHDIWMTFGMSTSEPKSCNIGLRNGIVPQEILETQQFRKIFPYMPTHSFYAGLFKQIQKNDLIDPQTNDFYTHAIECYIIWPLIEMANTHFKAFSEITYVVNCTDPIAKLIEDYHLRMACNSQMGKKLPLYQALDKL